MLTYKQTSTGRFLMAILLGWGVAGSARAGSTPSSRQNFERDVVEETKDDYTDAKTMQVACYAASGTFLVASMFVIAYEVGQGIGDGLGEGLAGMDADNGDGTNAPAAQPRKPRSEYMGASLLGASAVFLGLGIFETVQRVRCGRKLGRLAKRSGISGLKVVPYYDPGRRSEGLVAALNF